MSYKFNCRTPELRDGDLVVFRRPDSPLWQFRYRVKSGQWHRQSTKRASLEQAIELACESFDLARYRQRLGLAHTAHSFAQIAAVALASRFRHNFCIV